MERIHIIQGDIQRLKPMP